MGVPPSQAGVEEKPTTPQRKMSIPQIIFWGGLGLLLLIAVVMYVINESKSGDAGANVVQLYALIKYTPNLGMFQVTNTTVNVWHEATFTLDTSTGNYACRKETVEPNQQIRLEIKEFVNKQGGVFDPTTMTFQRFIITARLESGVQGRLEQRYGGPPKTP
jgi:hypothetical protein